MKKMLMINGSPRENGSSAEILNIIADKISGMGYGSEIINLGKLKISHCRGCMGCKKAGKCVIDDDMTPLYGKLQDADALAFAVPIYFSTETGLLKNFIDRLYALMNRRGDGTWDVKFGKPKKGVVAVNCGAPDGNMLYHGTMTHLTVVLGTFGASDIAAGIIPGTHSGVKGSPFLGSLLDDVEFQLSL
ncbi:MAG: flavodoxin family protein [Methanomassiliicoccaceae archaeon]|jgi:multimeric flavodoxin WrbA|nr:flavodoxin family protein [Methanomassiliicoccaceae archaeon]